MQKIVLITGASSGIGRSIAMHLAQKGEIVYGASRRAVNGTRDEGFIAVNMDVTSEESVQRGLQYILDQHGYIDAVINNAGTGFNGPVEDVTNEEVRNNFELNTLGTWNICRAVLPGMRKRGQGYIINITSVAGRTGLPFRSVYSATKHAVEGMSESLSMEVRRSGIHVCIVEPSEFRTSIVENRGSASTVGAHYSEDFRRVVEQVNRGVLGAPEPDAMGRCIEKILNNPSPRLRYVVASKTARLSILLKKILPGRVYERLVMKHYGLI